MIHGKDVSIFLANLILANTFAPALSPRNVFANATQQPVAANQQHAPALATVCQRGDSIHPNAVVHRRPNIAHLLRAAAF